MQRCEPLLINRLNNQYTIDDQTHRLKSEQLPTGYHEQSKHSTIHRLNNNERLYPLTTFETAPPLLAVDPQRTARNLVIIGVLQAKNGSNGRTQNPL